MAGIKQIYLLRHAQSLYNAAFEKDGKDPMIFDAGLSTYGLDQAKKLGDQLSDILPKIELIITSPLRRALETTLGLKSQVPIIVSSLPREQLEASCDIGTPTSLLQKQFPTLSFDHLEEIWWYTNLQNQSYDDHREMFKKQRYVEPLELVQERVFQFREWLKKQSQDYILVIGHADFFKEYCGQWLDNCQIYLTTL